MAGRPVLVVVAHPDDEILGCGGTAAHLVQEGRAVYFAILGEGITSRHENRADADPSCASLLHRHAQAAAAIVGVKDIFLYKLPDNRLDTVPLLQVVQVVGFRQFAACVSSECFCGCDHDARGQDRRHGLL